MPKSLRTADIARAAGVHPNTVRLYEEWGFLSRPERAANGYRIFTEWHRDQVLLIRALLRCTWLGGAVRQQALRAINLSAGEDLAAATEAGREVLRLMQDERSRAERAVVLLADWAATLDRTVAPDAAAATAGGMTIKQAAEWLAVTPDTLRNWDRNGLVTIRRHDSSGYRIYGPGDLRRLLVIRALRRARYSLNAILWMFQQLEGAALADPTTALETLRPGDEEIFFNTDRWLAKVREIEAFAGEALERLLDMAQRYPQKS